MLQLVVFPGASGKTPRTFNHVVFYCVLLQGFRSYRLRVSTVEGLEVNPHFGVIVSHRSPPFLGWLL